MDVSSAYDNVDFDILKRKLISEDCPKRISNFISRWLQTRKTEFIINNSKTILRNVDKGLPQGAIVSSVLYVFYTYNITNEIDDIKILQFVHDIALYRCSYSKLDNKNHLEAAIQTIGKSLSKIRIRTKKNELCRIF